MMERENEFTVQEAEKVLSIFKEQNYWIEDKSRTTLEPHILGIPPEKSSIKSFETPKRNEDIH